MRLVSNKASASFACSHKMRKNIKEINMNAVKVSFCLSRLQFHKKNELKMNDNIWEIKSRNLKKDELISLKGKKNNLKISAEAKASTV